jgi:sec-independent protein translocase protein TatA
LFNFGPWKLVLVLATVLVVFGPGKLPQVGEALGKAVHGFRKAQEGEEGEEKSQENKK